MGADEMGSIVDNIGLPVSVTGTTYMNSGTIGPEDGDILVTLKEGHAATASYVKTLRTVLPQSFPGSTFSISVQLPGEDRPVVPALRTILPLLANASVGGTSARGPTARSD